MKTLLFMITLISTNLVLASDYDYEKDCSVSDLVSLDIQESELKSDAADTDRLDEVRTQRMFCVAELTFEKSPYKILTYKMSVTSYNTNQFYKCLAKRGRNCNSKDIEPHKDIIKLMPVIEDVSVEAEAEVGYDFESDCSVSDLVSLDVEEAELKSDAANADRLDEVRTQRMFCVVGLSLRGVSGYKILTYKMSVTNYNSKCFLNKSKKCRDFKDIEPHKDIIKLMPAKK